VTVDELLRASRVYVEAAVRFLGASDDAHA
jgi:hypothetical protein